MQPMALVVSGVTCGELNVYGMVRIGKGSSRILSLRIEIVNSKNSNNSRPRGTIAIDSAKVVIADREDIAKHWCDNGPRRTGVIVFLKFPDLVQEIEKRFELRTKPRDPISAEIPGDVSGSLEKQIFGYLNSRPELQPSSKFYFHVETYSSFDRVNLMDSFWDILPIGRDDGPLMLAYQTGYGDGTYPVTGDYTGDRLVQIRLDFGSGHENPGGHAYALQKWLPCVSLVFG